MERHTYVDKDPHNHAGIKYFCKKMAKNWTDSQF